MRRGRFRDLFGRKGSGLVLAGAALLAAAVLSSTASGRTIVIADGLNGILTVDDVAGKVVGAPIATGVRATAVTVALDGKTAYVVDGFSSNLHVVDLRTRELIGAPIPVGNGPLAVAISPDGKRVYVVNHGARTVSVLDTATNAPVGEPIGVGRGPVGIAIAPDGATAYVGNEEDNTVSVIDLRAGTEVGTPIPVGDEPHGIAITPDGRTAYVANYEDRSISVIDTASNVVVTTLEKTVLRPDSIAIAPDGRTAYVAGRDFGEVAVIDTRSNAIVKTIDTDSLAEGIAIDPAGKTVYVVDGDERGLIRIDTATNSVAEPSITTGKETGGIALVPGQGPVARFTAVRARPGVPTKLNASTSPDPDGEVARYAWAFGDGGKANATRPLQNHVFRRPGTYTLSLQVTDDEGCSTALIYTGQTALCNGSGEARTERTITVAFPGVRVSCPRSAGRPGCRVRLQAVTSKRHPKPQSGVASAKLGAGKAKIVSVRPTTRFRGRLATARRILVKETIRTATSTRTRFARLKVVQ